MNKELVKEYIDKQPIKIVTKYSSEPNERIAQYYVKDGDFYVSRGNTTDLVAMAAIAHVKEDTPLTVFPDLMIRVRFNEKIVNEYVALVFNSSMGRYYFKYSAKGKNQTIMSWIGTPLY